MAMELRIDLDALPVGGKAQVTEGKAKVLFVRDADGVRAFQATCPHYGAPLEKGEICGAKLYCPWHKAVFDIGSGALLEPPALKSLDRYPVRIEAGAAIATLEPIVVAPPPRLPETRVVVVGTGAAAVAAIMTLRREGFAGHIAMVGREAAAPYDRTKLSKGFIAKPTPPDAMLLETDFAATHAVEWIVDAATSVDPQTLHVSLESGGVVAGDAILVATGSRAVRPSMPGIERGGVFTLRTLDDAVAISEAAENAKRVVIVGGGFIGLEAAAFLTKRGLHAMVVAQQALPFANRFGEAVATGLKDYHEGNGIHFVQGEVDRIDGDDHVRGVTLKGGATIAADFVLLGIGAAPETAVLAGVALRDDGGVAVDATLALAPGIYLAGDIAAFPGRDGAPVRIEHWRLAQQHGMHAAHAMLGREGPFRRAPFFWSNQGDKRLDYAGHAAEWDRIVTQGDPAALDFITYFIKDDRAIAACSIGRNADLIAYLDRLDSAGIPTAADVERGLRPDAVGQAA